MEQLHNGFTLNIPPDAFPLSTDSMVLSDFVKLPKKAAVLDLGSGCATLGVLLCAKDPGCTITGIELTEAAHRAALENIDRNGLQGRLFSICGDLRTIPQRFSSGSFQVCVSNPPYFTGGPASVKNPHARQADLCSMDDLFRSASWALQWGGDFFVVHKPESIAQLFSCAVRFGMEPKRLRLIRHDPTKGINLVLLQCRKGARPGVQWEEMCLFTPSGQPTEEYRRIYHL